MIQRFLPIADQRAATPELRWLTLAAPELARAARPGQYLLVRCAEEGSADPPLRRPLFVAAAEPALGQIALLYQPNERGLAWLARGRAGDTLDVLGPFGRGFALDARTRNLLLLGSGPGLAALLLLAAQASARGCAVTLLAAAEGPAGLPPPYLLPSEVEYQTTAGPALSLLATPAPPNGGAAKPAKKAKQRDPAGAPAAGAAALSPIMWADQICAALPGAELAELADLIRRTKYRWERGFASALLEGPLVCGVGACGACPVALRKGTRLLCADGPVFDMLALAV